MRIEDLKKDVEKGNMVYRGKCHDCSKQVEVTATLREDGAIAIDGTGSVYKIKRGIEDCYYFKCDACFAEDRTLRNYQDCEVFSRCVGYLRPVQQWNKGKREEFKMRKLFTNTVGK